MNNQKSLHNNASILVICLCGTFVLAGRDGCGGGEPGVLRTAQLCMLSGGVWDDSECPPSCPYVECGDEFAKKCDFSTCGEFMVCVCPPEAPYWVNGQGCWSEADCNKSCTGTAVPCEADCEQDGCYREECLVDKECYLEEKCYESKSCWVDKECFQSESCYQYEECWETVQCWEPTYSCQDANGYWDTCGGYYYDCGEESYDCGHYYECGHSYDCSGYEECGDFVDCGHYYDCSYSRECGPCLGEATTCEALPSETQCSQQMGCDWE